MDFLDTRNLHQTCSLLGTGNPGMVKSWLIDRGVPCRCQGKESQQEFTALQINLEPHKPLGDVCVCVCRRLHLGLDIFYSFAKKGLPLQINWNQKGGPKKGAFSMNHGFWAVHGSFVGGVINPI